MSRFLLSAFSCMVCLILQLKFASLRHSATGRWASKLSRRPEANVDLSSTSRSGRVTVSALYVCSNPRFSYIYRSALCKGIRTTSRNFKRRYRQERPRSHRRLLPAFQADTWESSRIRHTTLPRISSPLSCQIAEGSGGADVRSGRIQQDRNG